MSDEEKPVKLTNKQRVFVEEYLKCWNAAESARRAGYSVKSAYALGWETLRKPYIQAAIKERLAEVHMSADEALKVMADMARADMGEFIDASGVGFALNLRDAKERGLTRLIKKIKQKTTTFLAKSESDEDREVHELEIELYDAQAATRDILKIHGKFTDRIEVNGDVKVVIRYADTDESNNPPETA